MRGLVGLGIVAALGTNAKADVANDWVVLKVGRVTVDTKSANGTPWDQAGTKESSPCGLVSGIAPTLGVSVPVAMVATFFCESNSSKQVERDVRDPDLFVRVGVGDSRFQTPVAPNTADEIFDFPIVIPLAAIPAVGVDVQVLDLDADVNAGQAIGRVRVRKEQLAAAIASGKPLLELTDGRLKKIEFEIAAYDVTAQKPDVTFNVNQPPLPTANRVRAGELVTITASGSYGVRSSSEQTSVAGYGNKQLASYNLDSLKLANHGAAVAFINSPAGPMHTALSVGSCVAAVSPMPGVVHVGVNDSEVSNNTGSIDFSIKVSLPTVEEWRAGGAKCVVPPADATLTPDIVLKKIQSAYMAGLQRCYKQQVERKPDSQGKVVLSLTVGETGRTISGSAKGFSDEFEGCVGGLMTSWRFPVPNNEKGSPTQAEFSIGLRFEPSR